MKQVNLSLETAKEMYKSNDPSIKKFALDNYTKEELEEPILPKSWKDLKQVIGYYVNGNSDIRSTSTVRSDNMSKNVLPTKELAQAILALCQLLYLRDIYNGDWKADYTKSTTKYTILVTRGKIDFDTTEIVSRVLAFETLQLRRMFYENFKDLIEIAKPLL